MFVRQRFGTDREREREREREERERETLDQRATGTESEIVCATRVGERKRNY